LLQAWLSARPAAARVGLCAQLCVPESAETMWSHLELSIKSEDDCASMPPGLSSKESKEGGRAGLFSSCTFFLALSASADASSNQASIQLQKLIQDDGGRVVDKFENLVFPQHAFYMNRTVRHSRAMQLQLAHSLL